MRTILSALLLSSLLAACSSDDGDKNTNSNNSTVAPTNNASGSNNATTGSNNATVVTNNMSSTAGPNNTTALVDYISAEVDGTVVLADSAEGGVEPMGDTVQLRKTTADTASGGTVLIYRISLPNTDVASYDCVNGDVSVTYSQLDGQLINNWVATDTCTVEVTAGGDAAGDVIVGTFNASTSDGATTKELTNGEFSLTR